MQQWRPGGAGELAAAAAVSRRQPPSAAAIAAASRGRLLASHAPLAQCCSPSSRVVPSVADHPSSRSGLMARAKQGCGTPPSAGCTAQHPVCHPALHALQRRRSQGLYDLGCAQSEAEAAYLLRELLM